ncbi:MAG: hypothetical protein LBL58_13940 [Tannerellaceae bacterium]|jgi:hypothetical protein|nr:hypothetical protein [Tannerellaceae bacterium]
MPDQIIPSDEEDSIRLHDLIPEELIGFNTITSYLPVGIGLYNKFLPADYFKYLFKKCKSLSTEEKPPQNEIFSAYKNKVYELTSFINSIISRYKQQVKETDILGNKDNDSFLKEERHDILDRLIMSGDIDGDSEEQQTFVIKYLTTHPHPEYTDKNFIIEHIDKDVCDLVTRLYEISQFSPNEEKKHFDSFKLFCQNIIVHMRANHLVQYPKSIINYTCFMYDIEGYPYLTPSRRIYSINNYCNAIDNKFSNVIIYMKNTDALISYLYDITFKGDDVDPILRREWILRTAYCLCLALLAYRSEFVEYQTVTHNLFGTR